MNTIAGVVLAAMAVNFNGNIGKIRPELHSSGFGPTVASQNARDLADLKAMGFTYARTHDWALINANQRVCDWHHIFPLPKLDATNPEYYVFGPTDFLLKRTREEAGMKVFFRLGTSIEHTQRTGVHFNAAIPEDFDKVAEVFAGTVRHYNRSWADGYEWNIKYWEIWNEPDGLDDMWCLPEGDESSWDPKTPEDVAKKAKRRGLFVKFFVTCLKRLKEEFGDTIKVGGPALCVYKEDYFRELLQACKEADVAPDFISWHGYERDPMLFNRRADEARALCDSFGFTRCELILNEWHYFGDTYSWKDVQNSSDPEAKARIWDGPDSHNGIRSTCFTLAALANMQRSKMDQAYFYGCRHTGYWGFKDEMQVKYKVFYGLKLFGDIVKRYSTICDGFTKGSVTTLAVKDEDGRAGLLVVDYGGASRWISLKLDGVDQSAKPKCTLLDHRHDLTPCGVAFKDGVLTLEKPDFFSAAFFVEFGR